MSALSGGGDTMKHPLRPLSVATLVLALAGCSPGTRSAAAPNGGSFYTPAEPPSSRYVIDARVDVAAAAVEGRETVSLKNTGRAPIGMVAFDWTLGPSSTLEVTAGGRRLYPPDAGASEPQPRPIMVTLPEPVPAGATVELAVSFSQRLGGSRTYAEYSNDRWYPRLWWDGLAHHDAFSVKLDVPKDISVITSGRLDPRTGRYEAARARTF